MRSVSLQIPPRQRFVQRIRKLKWSLRGIRLGISLNRIWTHVEGKNEERIEDSSQIGAPPCAFVVEESICALLKLLRDCLWLLVTLEPSLVLLVKAPALILQCLGREVLLVSSLLIVEDVEQRIRIYTRI